MDRLIGTSLPSQSLLSTHKVLRNTYFLLSLTLAFSATTAIISILLNLPAPGLLLTMIGFYGLLFLTNYLANQTAGIFATFALTGFMGYTLNPLLSLILASETKEIIILALGGTASVFLCCSAYVLTTRKDMSFISGIMIAGLISIIIAIIANLFLHLPSLLLAINGMFILFSSGAILWETSNIIHGGEKNYIRATVSLYVSIYNIFVSLISIISGMVRKN